MFKCSKLKIQVSEYLSIMKISIFQFSVYGFHLVKFGLTEHVLLVWMSYKILRNELFITLEVKKEWCSLWYSFLHKLCTVLNFQMEIAKG